MLNHCSSYQENFEKLAYTGCMIVKNNVKKPVEIIDKVANNTAKLVVKKLSNEEFWDAICEDLHEKHGSEIDFNVKFAVNTRGCDVFGNFIKDTKDLACPWICSVMDFTEDNDPIFEILNIMRDSDKIQILN
jgi:hypothetical protein